MNFKKILTSITPIVLWILMVVVPTDVIANNDNDVTTAVDVFCRSEFQGVQERYDIAILSKDYLDKNNKEGHEFDGKVNLWDWDSYYVVTEYKILSVKSNGKSATADVKFMRIAYSKGKEEIRQDRLYDIVIYNLIYNNGKWNVIDPPKARISLDAIKIFYKTSMSRLDDNWKKHASKEQWKYYDKTKAVYDFLNKL